MLIGNSIPLYEISVGIFRLMWKILKNHYIVILRVFHWLIPILIITSISYASGYASILDLQLAPEFRISEFVSRRPRIGVPYVQSLNAKRHGIPVEFHFTWNYYRQFQMH